LPTSTRPRTSPRRKPTRLHWIAEVRNTIL
jgi:hypothetical protein